MPVHIGRDQAATRDILCSPSPLDRGPHGVDDAPGAGLNWLQRYIRIDVMGRLQDRYCTMGEWCVRYNPQTGRSQKLSHRSPQGPNWCTD